MNSLPTHKKSWHTHSPTFEEDRPGQFLKAQLSRQLAEPYFTSSDQEEQKLPPSRDSLTRANHKRTKSDQFEVSKIQHFTQQIYNQRGGDYSNPTTKRTSLGDERPKISESYWRPKLQPEPITLPGESRLPIHKANSIKVLQEASPSKEEAMSLSEDSCTIIGLHSEMSKIQLKLLEERDLAYRNRLGLKQQLIGLLSQNHDREELLTPRMPSHFRVSSASNITQGAAGSFFAIDNLELNSARPGLSRARPTTIGEESCTVKIESTDLLESESPESRKRTLLTALTMAFNSIPSTLMQKAKKAIETMVNSTLILLIDAEDHEFLGLYRINYTYNLLHKLAGLDSVPSSMQFTAVGTCFMFDTARLCFEEVASTRLTQTTHAFTVLKHQ